jgi:acetyl-CoA carboxylase biotin carboxyl carrier protein
MDFREIQELLKLISRLELTEFKMKDAEFELSVRTKNFDKARITTVAALPTAPMISTEPPAAPAVVAPVVAAVEAPKAATPEPAAAAPKADDESSYLAVKSPIVGTFYRSAGPDKPSLVKVGDSIKAGTVVCIIEAMKLFNEIESDISGRIVKVLVEDAQPVEYDQVLFLLDPKG